jgi:hypothetical protein
MTGGLAMTAFQDLSKEFSGWRDRYFEDQRKSLSLVNRTVEGFRKYIGAPETFTNPSGIVQRYVVPLVAKDNGDRTVSFREPDDPFDLLARWEDGYYHFGVSVAVEVAPNVWPKQAFTIPLSFVIKDNNCKMRVTNRSDGEFQFAVDNVETCTHMFGFMVSILSAIFKTKPSDWAEKKNPIGFLPPARS